MRWRLALVALLVAAPARAEPPPVRLALVVGQDVGAPGEERLRYAERDAARVHQLLTEIGGVEASRAYLLTGARAADVRRALDELRGRAAELAAAGQPSILLVYLSSHADRDALHLADSRLRYRDLRAALAGIPARLRLVVVDACESGAMVRRKGGVVVPAFPLDVGGSVAGEVVLTSAGRGEPAQEWDALGGSLFTHHLLTALRGAADRDGDGRVTLFEAQAYTYDRTLAASTGARAGLQHPGHDLELRGEGDVVLAYPGHGGGLLLAADAAGRYVVTTAVGEELVAAVDKAAGRAMPLALPPGRYLVRKPVGRFVKVGEVVVMPGRVAPLDEAGMEQVVYFEVGRRGGEVRPYAVELGARAELGAAVGDPALGGRLTAALRREAGPTELALELAYGRSELDGDELTIAQRELHAALHLRRRWPAGWLMPYLGARAGVGWIHQSLRRDQEALIQDAFGVGPMPDRDGALFLAGLTAGAELPLAGWWTLRLELSAGGTLAEVEGAYRLRGALGAGLAGGRRF